MVNKNDNLKSSSYANETIEAEPVKHGRWEDGVTCSKCGFIRQITRSGNPMVGRYCPYCGAKMDLKKGESE